MDKREKVIKVNNLYNLYQEYKEGYTNWHIDNIRDEVEQVYRDAKLDGKIDVLMNLYGEIRNFYVFPPSYVNEGSYNMYNLLYNIDLHIINFIYESIKSIRCSRFIDYAENCLSKEEFNSYFN